MDLWRAAESSWHEQAACRGAPPEIFFPEPECESAVITAKAFCDRCPVLTDCLNNALINRSSGIWGGKSTKERAKLSRIGERTKCPYCGAAPKMKLKTLIASVDRYQVCVRCGASWRTESADGRRKEDHGPVPGPPV